ncbi:MAG: hypothetical protein IJP48_10540 [Synergistaceae bacterium]|nr:hypothetical protein [Synergistaceae bacterium]
MYYLNKELTGQPKRKFKDMQEWADWVRATAGSITDETFVEPEDGYVLTEDEKRILSRQ